MVYFTADLHFGHKNIIKFCNRPFDSVEDMDNMLIKNWNDVVQYEDEIYIVGDFTMENGRAIRYLPRLNGKKYIITGNHDKFLHDTEEFHTYFEWIKEYEVISRQGFKWVLFHYPIAEWSGFYKGAIHLHGHVHNREIAYSWGSAKVRAFNVGVDVNGYKPVSINEIIKRAGRIPVMERKPI